MDFLMQCCGCRLPGEGLRGEGLPHPFFQATRTYPDVRPTTRKAPAISRGFATGLDKATTH